jgi:hypothetical protein
MPAILPDVCIGEHVTGHVGQPHGVLNCRRSLSIEMMRRARK